MLLIVLQGLVAHAVVHPTPQVNVILIGWDGAQRGHVMEALEPGELPNLQRLIAKGSLVRINIEGVTDTKAGWSQILTGYYLEAFDLDLALLEPPLNGISLTRPDNRPPVPISKDRRPNTDHSVQSES